MKHQRCAVAAIVTLALALPRPILAAGPQERTGRKVQEVILTQATSGEEIRGQLVELSSRSVSMLVNNRPVELPLDSVLRIDVRGDSVKNGAIIGALVLGTWCAIICGQAIGGSELPAVAATQAGFGALIGAGIDAMIKGRSPIYVRPKATAGPPVPAAKGVMFKFRF